MRGYVQFNKYTHTHTLASVVQQSQKNLRPLQASLLLGIKYGEKASLLIAFQVLLFWTHLADTTGDACGAVCVRRFRVRVSPKPYPKPLSKATAPPPLFPEAGVTDEHNKANVAVPYYEMDTCRLH